MQLLGMLDSQFHQQETKVSGEQPVQWLDRDLAICALFLRDNVSQCTLSRERMVSKRVEFTKATQQRFIAILLRVARAQDGISRQERVFLGQFWWEFQRVWADKHFAFR